MISEHLRISARSTRACWWLNSRNEVLLLLPSRGVILIGSCFDSFVLHIIRRFQVRIHSIFSDSCACMPSRGLFGLNWWLVLYFVFFSLSYMCRHCEAVLQGRRLCSISTFMALFGWRIYMMYTHFSSLHLFDQKTVLIKFLFHHACNNTWFVCKITHDQILRSFSHCRYGVFFFINILLWYFSVTKWTVY